MCRMKKRPIQKSGGLVTVAAAVFSLLRATKATKLDDVVVSGHMWLVRMETTKISSGSFLLKANEVRMLSVLVLTCISKTNLSSKAG